MAMPSYPVAERVPLTLRICTVGTPPHSGHIGCVCSQQLSEDLLRTLAVYYIDGSIGRDPCGAVGAGAGVLCMRNVTLIAKRIPPEFQSGLQSLCPELYALLLACQDMLIQYHDDLQVGTPVFVPIVTDSKDLLLSFMYGDTMQISHGSVISGSVACNQILDKILLRLSRNPLLNIDLHWVRSHQPEIFGNSLADILAKIGFYASLGLP